MSTKVYKPSGVKIDVISTHDDGEYLMVRSNTTGKVFFAHKDQVDVFQEDTEPKATSNSVSVRRGRRNFKKDEPEAPVVIKPLPPIDNRINLTAEGLTQCLPGVGLKTAKEIIELRQSLPGERFTKLDQLSSIKRVDWDEVFATGSVYVE